MSLTSLFGAHTRKIPKELKYIMLIFFASRIILGCIGAVSRQMIGPFIRHHIEFYSRHVWLNIWGQWDSGWFMCVAENWYAKGQVISGQCNYGFFPLYPLLVKVFSLFTKDFFISGLIVANLALIAASVILVKLVKLEYDEKTALDSAKFMFFFPTAFILSGMYSESLYLALALSCFYCAKKEKWCWAGMSGFFLALTRPEGLLIVLPLSYLYFKQRNFSLRAIRSDVLCLLFAPLGTFAFMAYTRYRMGDWFAYAHANRYWDFELSNPAASLFYALFKSHDPALIFGALFSLSAFLLLIACYRRIGFAYWLFGIYTVVLPAVFNRANIFSSTGRYTLLVFPLFIILAIISRRNKDVKLALTAGLCLLQGFFMVFWANGFKLVV